jgi:uncharacterized protein (TIGR04255 family)
MGQFDDNEVYPNQPLSDVACEVRFKGEMQVECERYRFWDAIRDTYPDIFVPQIKDGQFLALQHYKFTDSSSNRTVAVALNSIAFAEKKYSGHKSFIEEFTRLIAIFRKLYPKVGKITRIGWRYINVMPFSREDGLVPLGRILRFDMSLPLDMFKQTANIDLKWTGKQPNGEVIMRLSDVVQKNLPEQEAMILDIDFGYSNPEITWGRVEGAISDARRSCRSIFEGLITDEYRTYLRGQTI